MKSFLIQPKKRSRKRFLLIGAILVVVLLLPFLRPLVASIGVPFAHVAFFGTGVVERVQVLLTDKQSLHEENEMLQNTIVMLESRLTSAGAGGSSSFEDTDGVPARVVLRPSHNIYGTVVLRLDSELPSGEHVVTDYAGNMLGTLERAAGSLALVRLSSHDGMTSEAFVERTGIPIQLEGVGSGNMQAVVPEDADVEVGDVLVHGETGRRMGEVLAIDRQEADAFKRIYGRIPVNMYELQSVLVAPRISMDVSTLLEESVADEENEI